MKYTVIHTIGESKFYSISFERINCPFWFTIESDMFCQAIQQANYYYKERFNAEFWEEMDNL